MLDRGQRLELLTPRGAGGIAVVAISGPGRATLASGWLRTRGGGPLDLTRCHVPRLALLHPGREVLDEVLVLERPMLQRVEIHLHGSEAVLQALEQIAGPLGSAMPCIRERLLEDAMCDAQLAFALEQRTFDLRRFLGELEPLPRETRASALVAAIERSRIARALIEPARLVLCGAQNAGKSTLMNRLLFAERVLTGPQPGLTRDPVQELCTLAGYPYLLIDTAGEGAIPHELHGVDQLALQRARDARQQGLRLLVVDGQVGFTALEERLCAEHVRKGGAGADSLHEGSQVMNGSLLVCNKTDLPQAPWPDHARPWVAVSCREQAAPRIREAIGQALRALRGLPPAGPLGGVAALDAAERALLAECHDGIVRADGDGDG